jgi:nitrogen regulatory protein PII
MLAQRFTPVPAEISDGHARCTSGSVVDIERRQELVMKKIETLIQAQNWESVREQLSALGIRGTLRQVNTFGYAPPTRAVHRGTSYEMNIASGLELALVVRDELVEQIVSALEANGCVEVLVSPVERLQASSDSQPAAAAVQRAPSRERPAVSRSRVFSYT